MILAAERRLDVGTDVESEPSTEGGGQRRWPRPVVGRGRSEVLFLRQSEGDLVMDNAGSEGKRKAEMALLFHLSS